MDKEKRKALEAAGFRVGTVREFLGLTDEENQIVELRVALSRRVRELREKSHLTQKQLATKLGSSQSRIAKLEAGSSSISLDLMFRGFFATGGRLVDLTSASGRSNVGSPRRSAPKTSKAKASKSSGRLAGSGVA